MQMQNDRKYKEFKKKLRKQKKAEIIRELQLIKEHKEPTNRQKKEIITSAYYKADAKKSDYNDKSNKLAFLNQFLNDATFLRLYEKMNKDLKKDIRKHRRLNNLECVYSKVKAQYEN